VAHFRLVSARVRLRPWQHAALGRFSAGGRDFLAVATPGAGKTTFALAALRTVLAECPARVVVVAPTAHLKVQWAAAAARFGLHLDPAWSPAEGPPPVDMHGVVTTYQQVSLSGSLIGAYAEGGYVVLDEIHHAGDEQAWGASLRAAFDRAARRLALSGTPFRSDTRAIPFVRYVGDEAEPDFEYGYGDALRDGRVVRPVYFPRLGGEMEWQASDGEVHSATFEDPLASELANQRLRTALSLDGELLPTIVGEAVARLRDVRRTQPDAGGLAIAIDQEHARGIADLLRRRHGVDAQLALSDDPDASRRIETFARGTGEWLVAVRMVSEGVDIPRLRVGVYATTTTTDLFFRQAVGRFVRWVPGIREQRAWLYLPDDPRLRVRATTIAEQRRHSLRRESAQDGERDALPAGVAERIDDGEQLSLFAALSATPTGQIGSSSPWHEPLPEDWGDASDATIEIELAPPPPVGVSSGPGVPGLPDGPAGPGLGGRSRAQVRAHLRSVNATLARDLVRVTGMTHAQVNLELNRRAGIVRIGEATIEQLGLRAEAAQRWRAKLAR
jgi:superfamily II DNA or RNA helicase